MGCIGGVEAALNLLRWPSRCHPDDGSLRPEAMVTCKVDADAGDVAGG